MNSQIREFFRVDGTDDPHFKSVRFISEEEGLSWEEAKKTGLSRGWYELSRVSVIDRVEFTRDFWLSVLPFHPTATGAIRDFFAALDDVAVVISRQSDEAPWEPELVYSLRDNSSFFRGRLPADEETIELEMKRLGKVLPKDFRAFLHIHNGFGKLTELSLLPIDEMEEARRQLIDQIVKEDRPLRSGEQLIDPNSLYPFFAEYGGSYQCFLSEWYPGSEMGNVYFSGIDYLVSDTLERKSWGEHLAYPTFLEWLSSFIGGMNVSP